MTQEREQWGPEEIAAMVAYNPEDGSFIWQDRPDSHFASPKDAKIWRRRFLGKAAFITDNGKGYMCANLSGRRYYGHRVAFACMTGDWPKHEVDHINGNPSDNRWANLRDVTHTDNNRNMPAPKKKAASGVTGIYRTLNRACWAPQVSVGNRSIPLGNTPCLGIAIKRRREAEQLLGFHPNHGRKYLPPRALIQLQDMVENLPQPERETA